jgi:hypothetical protein
VGVERVALEDHRDVALARLEVGDLALAEVDGAGADLLEAGEQAQQGGLAAAARADQHGEAAALGAEVDAPEDGLTTEFFVDAFELEPGHGAARIHGTPRAGMGMLADGRAGPGAGGRITIATHRAGRP